jgi:hypothetical protein
VNDSRARERFAEAVPSARALQVQVSTWRWSPQQPRLPWSRLKEAAVWTQPEFEGLRRSLRKPPPLPAIVVSKDAAALKIADFEVPGPAPPEDVLEESLAATQPLSADPAASAAKSKKRPQRDPDEPPPTHRQRVFLYKAEGDVPEVASQCNVGLLLLEAPPQASVRLPAHLVRLLDSTPTAVYGSPGNVAAVVADIQNVVGGREHCDVDVWVRPSTGTQRFVKRRLVVVSKMDWIYRSRV